MDGNETSAPSRRSMRRPAAAAAVQQLVLVAVAQVRLFLVRRERPGLCARCRPPGGRRPRRSRVAPTSRRIAAMSPCRAALCKLLGDGCHAARRLHGGLRGALRLGEALFERAHLDSVASAAGKMTSGTAIMARPCPS